MLFVKSFFESRGGLRYFMYAVIDSERHEYHVEQVEPAFGVTRQISVEDCRALPHKQNDCRSKDKTEIQQSFMGRGQGVEPFPQLGKVVKGKRQRACGEGKDETWVNFKLVHFLDLLYSENKKATAGLLTKSYCGGFTLVKQLLGFSGGFRG